MPYEIRYHPLVPSEDLPALDASAKQRIREAINRRLSTSPQTFGKPLRRTLRGLWALRAGDYRVVYQIAGRQVRILRVGHRSEVYRFLAKRMRLPQG